MVRKDMNASTSHLRSILGEKRSAIEAALWGVLCPTAPLSLYRLECEC